MRLYIACGLTHVPRSHFPAYTHLLHSLAEALIRQGHGVYYALVNSDPQLANKPFGERARLCYLWDREMVERADILIAEATYPSTGMGIELQIAASNGIPIIICFRAADSNKALPVEYQNPDHSYHHLQIGEGYVSLMALGVPGIFRAIGYSHDRECIDDVLENVELLDRQRSG